MHKFDTVEIIGGGLAGCEAAWQLLRRGFNVRLFEQRPERMTPAHKTDQLAELVCSNSFRSDSLSSAVGLLKAEMRLLDSLIMSVADECRVPAGQALAVDRKCFSSGILVQLQSFAGFELVRKEVTSIPENKPLIIATGPLTSDSLTEQLRDLIGFDYLYFYDAISPIVIGDSIDRKMAFWASRYGKGEDDYLNCPMSKEEYEQFIDALLKAEQYPTQQFENVRHFEGCLPIEEMAVRGHDALRFGPMKPVGLNDPKTDMRPYAVLQLRQDDLAAEHFNLVGCQTKMRQADQKRVFRMIPALRNAEFARFGQMHRNSFINSPAVLDSSYQVRKHKQIFIAGQLSGVEGYVESAASGLAAGIYMGQFLANSNFVTFPPSTAIGALAWYIVNADPTEFQPMNITFGLLQQEGITPQKPRRARREAQVKRALSDVRYWTEQTGFPTSQQANN